MTDSQKVTAETVVLLKTKKSSLYRNIKRIRITFGRRSSSPANTRRTRKNTDGGPVLDNYIFVNSRSRVIVVIIIIVVFVIVVAVVYIIIIIVVNRSERNMDALRRCARSFISAVASR